MTPTEEAAKKLLDAAINGFKERVRNEAMGLPPLSEYDAQRRELVSQFQIASDVGKTIAAIAMR